MDSFSLYFKHIARYAKVNKNWNPLKKNSLITTKQFIEAPLIEKNMPIGMFFLFLYKWKRNNYYFCGKKTCAESQERGEGQGIKFLKIKKGVYFSFVFDISKLRNFWNVVKNEDDVDVCLVCIYRLCTVLKREWCIDL